MSIIIKNFQCGTITLTPSHDGIFTTLKTNGMSEILPLDQMIESVRYSLKINLRATLTYAAMGEGDSIVSGHMMRDPQNMRLSQYAPLYAIPNRFRCLCDEYADYELSDTSTFLTGGDICGFYTDSISCEKEFVQLDLAQLTVALFTMIPYDFITFNFDSDFKAFIHPEPM